MLFVVELVSVLVSKATWTSHGNIRGDFPFLFLGGFIVTSVFFSDDMFSKRPNTTGLLPATSLEKFSQSTAVRDSLSACSDCTSRLPPPSGGHHPVHTSVRDVQPSESLHLKMLLLIAIDFPGGRNYFHSAHFIKTVLALGIISSLGGLFIVTVGLPYTSSGLL